MHHGIQARSSLRPPHSGHGHALRSKSRARPRSGSAAGRPPRCRRGGRHYRERHHRREPHGVLSPEAGAVPRGAARRGRARARHRERGRQLHGRHCVLRPGCRQAWRRRLHVRRALLQQAAAGGPLPPLQDHRRFHRHAHHPVQHSGALLHQHGGRDHTAPGPQLRQYRRHQGGFGQPGPGEGYHRGRPCRLRRVLRRRLGHPRYHAPGRCWRHLHYRQRGSGAYEGDRGAGRGRPVGGGRRGQRRASAPHDGALRHGESHPREGGPEARRFSRGRRAPAFGGCRPRAVGRSGRHYARGRRPDRPRRTGVFARYVNERQGTL